MRLKTWGILLGVALLLSMVIGLAFGSVAIPLQTVARDIINVWQGMQSPNEILFGIRLPRIFFAACAGASLGLTGLLMQTVSQNYLADPYILGVSSGASAGAVFCIVSGTAGMLGGHGIYFGAFAGAVLATGIVMLLAGSDGSPVRLVLMGMGISALFSAITMFFIYGAKDEAQVRSAMFWLMGSLAGIQWQSLPPMLVTLFCLLIFIYLYRHELDILLLGRDEARHVGMEVNHLQRLIVLVTSAAVAIVVALAGLIGFVGLIVPHLARFSGAQKHGHLLWLVSLVGALVLVWSDLLARTLFAPEELPIGVLTAGFGAPIFLWMIHRNYGGE